MALTQNHAALNNLILAAAHAAQGQNAQAMTCLAAAATDPDLDEALSELNDELEEAGSECEELSEDELEEAGEALAKVMAANAKSYKTKVNFGITSPNNEDADDLLNRGHAHKTKKPVSNKTQVREGVLEPKRFIMRNGRRVPVHATEEETMEPETASAAMSPSALIAAAHNRANRL